uniref:E3 ubiquitin-protein ligase E3D n=1 Tax=Amblyomma aureolatum TaxID=187763 RepID=A0A1E1XC79_9ACAR
MDCWLEVRPLLKVCKVQLLLWNADVGTVTVDCFASCIRLTVHRRRAGGDKALIELVFPDDYIFQGETLTPPTESSTVRERKGSTEPLPCREVTFIVRFDNENSGVESNAEFRLIAGEPYRFMCASCSAQIMGQDKIFRRVLPLPSEDWKEAAGDWFCDSHVGTNGGAVPDVLAPRADELFTSARHFLVHDTLLGEAVKREAGKLLCGSCNVVLGKKAAESSSALFTTRVNISPVGIGENGHHIGGDAVGLLSNFIKEHLEMSKTCRMIFESGEQVMLLWLMETGLALYSAEELQPGQHTVQLRVGSKLLYLETETSDKVVQAWKNDALVGVHQLEPELLKDSSRMLFNSGPSTAVTWDRFRVAFLPGIVEGAVL